MPCVFKFGWQPYRFVDSYCLYYYVQVVCVCVTRWPNVWHTLMYKHTHRHTNSHKSTHTYSPVCSFSFIMPFECVCNVPFFELVKNVKNIVVANEQRTKTNCLTHTLFLHEHHTHIHIHTVLLSSWQGTSYNFALSRFLLLKSMCLFFFLDSHRNEIYEKKTKKNFTRSQWNVWIFRHQ